MLIESPTTPLGSLCISLPPSLCISPPSPTAPPASCYKPEKRDGRTCSKGQDLLCSTVDETPRLIQFASASNKGKQCVRGELRRETNKEEGSPLFCACMLLLEGWYARSIYLLSLALCQSASLLLFYIVHRHRSQLFLLVSCWS